MDKIFKIISAGTLVLVSIFCSTQEKNPLIHKELPDQIVTNFNMYESITGEKLYFLKAQKALYFTKAGRIILKSPDIVFFADNGDVKSHVTADSGIIYTSSGNLVAIKNVVFDAGDSTFLYTDSILWNNSRRLIETDAKVRIITKDGEINGIGLVSDSKLNEITIKNNIEGNTEMDMK